MILMNVNGKDSIDIEKVFLVLDDYDQSAAKKDNRYISLSRTDKTRSFLITTDNLVYGLSLTPAAFIKKYYATFQDYGVPPKIAFKITASAYYIGIADIILITDTLSRILDAERDRLDKLGRTFNISTRKTKTFIFVKGVEDTFLVKTNMARSTVVAHAKEAIKRYT